MTQHLLSTVKNCRPDSLCGKRPIGKPIPRIINDARPAIGTKTHPMLSKQFDQMQFPHNGTPLATTVDFSEAFRQLTHAPRLTDYGVQR